MDVDLIRAVADCEPEALDECIREFMAKPAPVRHLYEIHTVPQPPLVADVLSGDIVAELARLREFL